MSEFSSRRSFIGGAISTAVSPLRNNFEASCWSPPASRKSPGVSWLQARQSEQQYESLGQNSDQYKAQPSSQYLSIPQHGAINPPHEQKALGNNGAKISPSRPPTHPASETHSFPLPQTPQFAPFQRTGTLSTFSAITLILGKTVGVSIYALPSSILASVGSVGACLTLWVIGSLISFCGLSVYLSLGCALPHSGGERVYLERIFRKPRMLATCMFGSYVVLLGFSTPNCIVLGEYVMYALEIEANRWNVRCLAVAVITLLCFIHARHQRLGLRIIDILGVGKMLILAIFIVSGIVGASMGAGSPAFLSRRRLVDGPWSVSVDEGPNLYRSTAHRNFSNVWAGSSTQPYDYATALLKILYCFRGYSTANQVLSSVRNPVPTLKRAAPTALSLISIGYILANISYFLIVEKEDFKNAGVVIAGHFFRNIFGQVMGENLLPILVIFSAFGNIAATSFAQARVNQELGKDGLLPFSGFFSTKKVHMKGKQENENSDSEEPPMQGLLLHWLVSVLVIILPPPGEIYNFLVEIGGYPISVISVAISLGLLYLQSNPRENWESPFAGKKVYTIIFAASNLLLVITPWIKPRHEKQVGKMVYFAYPATGLAILGLGAIYWVWWANVKQSGVAQEPYERWRQGDRGEENLPMMGHHRSQSEEVEVEVGRLMSGDWEKNIWQNPEDDDATQSMRRRAPCGCPAIH